MTYIKKDFFDFFKELAANNHKDWFDENRKRYQNAVKLPFENLVNAIIENVSEWDEPLPISHKESVFRINRDIRFSSDKTPYKTNRTALISKYGRANKIYPGFYLFLSPEKAMIGGGAYFLEKEDLFKVRQEIAYNLEEFKELIENKDFKNTFGEVLGDKNKVAPKEFKEDVVNQPLLYNKGFYFMKELPAETALEDNAVTQFTNVMKKGLAFNAFLRRALVD